MKNLVKKVQNTVFLHKLFNHGDKILLAVSGGPDSTCLLDVFSKLQKKYNLQLAIIHVNYGLRGKDSNNDEKFVKALAEKYNLKIFIHKPSVQKNSSENIFRDIRYNFFEKIRKENNFDYIAVAHNSDDQVETYLMRIVRGAGLKGLSGMLYKNNKVIRPLLNLDRDEIKKYLRENKLKFRLDKTNLESKFLRNRIRNKLIPYLEKNFNPQIKKTIFSSLESIVEDMEFICQAAEKISTPKDYLSVSKIMTLEPAIKKRVVLREILRKKGDLRDIESSHVNEIIKLISSTKSKRQIMRFKGLKVERRGDRLIIEHL